jgi:hypothetical protein
MDRRLQLRSVGQSRIRHGKQWTKGDYAIEDEGLPNGVYSNLALVPPFTSAIMFDSGGLSQAGICLQKTMLNNSLAKKS